MTYHVRNKAQVERRNIEQLKKLLAFLEAKPNKQGMIMAQIKALHWAINKLEVTNE